MSELRYFKCNVLGGFRLSDLDKNIKQGDYFFIDKHVAETSRAVVAALRDKWMIEVDEKEASQHVSIPKSQLKGGVKDTHISRKKVELGVAVPNVSEVNRKLESRQTENNKLAEKPITPNVAEVQENTKERHKDSMNKTGASTDEELLKDKTIEKPERTKVVEDEGVKSLVNDEIFDNSELSTPSLEKSEVKEEIKKKLNTKIKRKRGRKAKRRKSED